MANILIVLISVTLAVLGQLLMKQGMNSFGSFPVNQLLSNLIPMLLNPWVFFGFMLFGISSVFWLVALSRLDLSLVYPMVSLAYVAVAFASIFIFKESVSFLRWIGIIIICSGVFFISRS